MSTKQSTEPLRSPGYSSDDLAKLVGYFHGNLTNEARRYLHSRGITDETIDQFDLGYDTGLSSLGSALRYRIIFPVKEVNGTYRDLVGRLINDADSREYGRWRNLAGQSSTVFNEPVIPRSDTIYLCEGPLDALSLIQTGLPAVGVLDIGTFPRRVAELLSGKTVYICYDNDEDGRREGRRTAEALLSAGCREIYIVAIPEDYKDINDLFVAATASGKDAAALFRSAAQSAVEEGVYSSIPSDAMSSSAFYHQFLVRSRGGATPPSTGIGALDAMLLGGLWEGLYAIVGPPGVGKTALLGQIADSVANQGVPSVFVSLETSAYELWAAGIARRSGLPLADVFSGRVDLEKVKEANEAQRRSARFIWTVEVGRPESGQPLEHVVGAIRKERGKTPVVIIDHLQPGMDQGIRVADARPDLSREDVLLALKRLSRDHGCPVLIASSQSPVSPITSHTTSEQIGFTADVLIEMSKSPGAVAGDSPTPADASVPVQFRVVKNRGGRVGALTLTLNRPVGVFT